MSTPLTEAALVEALAKLRKDGAKPPTKVVVSDAVTELIARRILHSTDPKTGQPHGGDPHLGYMAVECDPHMERGTWSLR